MNWARMTEDELTLKFGKFDYYQNESIKTSKNESAKNPESDGSYRRVGDKCYKLDH